MILDFITGYAVTYFVMDKLVETFFVLNEVAGGHRASQVCPIWITFAMGNILVR